MTTDSIRSSSAAEIAFAWVFVGLPLLWGVSQTVMKSLDLFR